MSTRAAGCLLCHPLAARIRVQPARCTRRLPSSMKKRTYSRCRTIVSTVKKSTASTVQPCARKKFAPRKTRALAVRCEATFPEKRATGCGRDRKAESLHLANKALVSHRGFSRANRRTTSRISRPTGGLPARCEYDQRLATSWRCQRSSVVGVMMNDRQRARGRSRLAAARKSRSLSVTAGRPVRRRKMASSWRSTMISSSFNASV
jgi:hypothetical protein